MQHTGFRHTGFPDSGFRPKLVIGDVPFHAMLVPFPIVCFIGALIADIAYVNSPQVQWVNFAAWLLAFGELLGALAALFGLGDLLLNNSEDRPSAAWFHFGGSATALILGLLNNFVHARDGWTSVHPAGIMLSALTVLVLLGTGFLGGRLAHIQHHEETV